MKYTNNENIPLSIAVWLIENDYDGNEAKTGDTPLISVTTLIKPIKQIILGIRVPEEDSVIDVSSLIASSIGTAIHNAIDLSWIIPQPTLEALGINKSVVDRIRVNPKKLTTDALPVYKEKRTTKNINGWDITGKFDFVIDGSVEDFKTTSVYTYISKSNDEAYALQGSIYKWLNQDIILGNFIGINYIFKDWSRIKAAIDAKYPKSQILQYKVPLKSVMETQAYIINKLNDINKYMNSPELDIPDCTDKDLWRSDSVWKYYKNPAKMTRSTKNFDNSHDAYIRKMEDNNVGVVLEVKGEVRACKYCAAASICQQKDNYIADGTLKL